MRIIKNMAILALIQSSQGLSLKKKSSNKEPFEKLPEDYQNLEFTNAMTLEYQKSMAVAAVTQDQNYLSTNDAAHQLQDNKAKKESAQQKINLTSDQRNQVDRISDQMVQQDEDDGKYHSADEVKTQIQQSIAVAQSQKDSEQSKPIWEKKSSEANDVTAFAASTVYKVGLADEDEPAIKTQQAYDVQKPQVGNFGEFGAQVNLAAQAEQNRKETAQLVNAAIMASGGNKRDPSLQIAIAESSSQENHEIVTKALEESTNDLEEEKAIEKISSQVVSDEEIMSKISKKAQEQQDQYKGQLKDSIQALHDGQFDNIIYGSANGSTKDIIPLDQRHNYAQDLPDVPEMKNLKISEKKPELKSEVKNLSQEQEIETLPDVPEFQNLNAQRISKLSELNDLKKSSENLHVELKDLSKIQKSQATGNLVAHSSNEENLAQEVMAQNQMIKVIEQPVKQEKDTSSQIQHTQVVAQTESKTAQSEPPVELQSKVKFITDVDDDE